MKPEDLDRELGRLFQAQRAADEAAAPDLSALLARPPARRSGRRGVAQALALVAAVAVVVLAGARVLRNVASAPRETTDAIETLAEWRSPTAFLLRTPGSDIWTQMPALGSAAHASEDQPGLSPTKGVDQ